MKYDSASFSFSFANNAKKLPNLLHVLLKRYVAKQVWSKWHLFSALKSIWN
ncbi:hypothetical protein PULV_a1486 [Pseudoalteromonas ulvae UL12]|nr:hypothetical protein [Pseudoalteromonas ulvae UL12]